MLKQDTHKAKDVTSLTVTNIQSPSDSAQTLMDLLWHLPKSTPKYRHGAQHKPLHVVVIDMQSPNPGKERGELLENGLVVGKRETSQSAPRIEKMEIGCRGF